jgi:hypothetical protein
LPGGPPLPLAPPCNRQRPGFVAGDRQGFPLLRTRHPSFDHLVGAREQRRWHCEAERLGGGHPPLLLQQSPRSRTRFSHACFAGRVMSGLRRFEHESRTPSGNRYSSRDLHRAAHPPPRIGLGRRDIPRCSASRSRPIPCSIASEQTMHDARKNFHPLARQSQSSDGRGRPTRGWYRGHVASYLPYSQRRQTGGAAGSAIHEDRAGDQSQDREGAWARFADICSAAR